VFVLGFALVNHGLFAKLKLPDAAQNATVYKAFNP
jgi:hypothetical protein